MERFARRMRSGWGDVNAKAGHVPVEVVEEAEEVEPELDEALFLVVW